MDHWNIRCDVPKLTNKQYYSFWRIQMEDHFRAHKLLRFIDNELSEDDTHMSKRRMYLALSQIHQGIDMSIFGLVCKATTAKEAWDALEKAYGDENQIQQSKVLILKENFELVEDFDLHALFGMICDDDFVMSKGEVGMIKEENFEKFESYDSVEHFGFNILFGGNEDEEEFINEYFGLGTLFYEGKDLFEKKEGGDDSKQEGIDRLVHEETVNEQQMEEIKKSTQGVVDYLFKEEQEIFCLVNKKEIDGIEYVVFEEKFSFESRKNYFGIFDKYDYLSNDEWVNVEEFFDREKMAKFVSRYKKFSYFSSMELIMKINYGMRLYFIFTAKEFAKEVEARDGVGVFSYASLV